VRHARVAHAGSFRLVQQSASTLPVGLPHASLSEPTLFVRTRLTDAALNTLFAGAGWLHVDDEPHLDGLYRGCGCVGAHVIDLGSLPHTTRNATST